MADKSTFELSRREVIAGGIGLIGGGVLGGVLGGLVGGNFNGAGIKGIASAPKWTLQIQGGYGLFFKDSQINVLAPKATACGHNQEHAMVLVVEEGEGIVDAETTFTPQIGAKNERYWILDGDTKFVDGMPGKGVTPKYNTTKWGDLTGEYGPDNPDNNPTGWNDLVWLPGPAKAVANVEKYAARTLLVTDGDMYVLPPANIFGRAGRWYFSQSAPNKKALTDRFVLTGPKQPRIAIQSKSGAKDGLIVLKPDGDILNMAVRHAVVLDDMCFEVKQPLPHFAMLYDFVDPANCASGIVPTFEARSKIKLPDCKGATPGNLCPPLMIEP